MKAAMKFLLVLFLSFALTPKLALAQSRANNAAGCGLIGALAGKAIGDHYRHGTRGLLIGGAGGAGACAALPQKSGKNSPPPQEPDTDRVSDRNPYNRRVPAARNNETVLARNASGFDGNKIAPLLESGLEHLGYAWIDPQFYQSTNPKPAVDVLVDVITQRVYYRQVGGGNGGHFLIFNGNRYHQVSEEKIRVSIRWIDPKTGHGLADHNATEEILIKTYQSQNGSVSVFTVYSQSWQYFNLQDPATETTARALERMLGLR